MLRQNGNRREHAGATKPDGATAFKAVHLRNPLAQTNPYRDARVRLRGCGRYFILSEKFDLMEVPPGVEALRALMSPCRGVESTNQHLAVRVAVKLMGLVQ